MSEAQPENIVQLEQRREVAREVVAASELEHKRLVFFRAVELVEKQLDHDARKMEESAIVSEHPIQRRHELMDTARCLRITQTWLYNLRQPVEPEPGKDGNVA